ncbi:hypothetical protein [Pseudoruegeria sp. SHC-113]|uniref:hypothetical protein n=1 Tax=Pseudoruegeria sp. SHC-113 TaxID=2855439 RepID=UPI0028E09FED|nr:hypothetical protein [Pseudoruegeria sp. SHC-113]
MLLALVALIWLPSASMAETRLFMAEEPGCPYCAQWNREIGGIYAKTPEGRAAPLERFDLRAPPDGLELARRIAFSPTFVLAHDGVEVSRIEGYPGEDFFWGLLQVMLTDAEIAFDDNG